MTLFLKKLFFLFIITLSFETFLNASILNSIDTYTSAKKTCEYSKKIPTLKIALKELYQIKYLLPFLNDKKLKSEINKCQFEIVKLSLKKENIKILKEYLFLSLKNDFSNKSELTCLASKLLLKDKDLAIKLTNYLYRTYRISSLKKADCFDKIKHLEIKKKYKARKNIDNKENQLYKKIQKTKAYTLFNQSADLYFKKYKNGIFRTKVKNISVAKLSKYLLEKTIPVRAFTIYKYLTDKDLLKIISAVWKQNNLKKAIALLKIGEKWHPNKTKFTHLIASAYEDLWNLKQAIKYHEKYVSFGFGGTYYNKTIFKLGFLNLLLGQKTKAMSYFKQVLKSKTTDDRSAAIYWGRQAGLQLSNIDSNPLSIYAVVEDFKKLKNNKNIFDGIIKEKQNRKENKIHFIESYALDLFDEFVVENKIKNENKALLSKLIQSVKFSQYLSPKYLNKIALAFEQLNAFNETIRFSYYRYSMQGNSFKSIDDLTYFFSRYYKDKILKYSKKHKISPAITFGIARRESAFNHKAVSRVGAQGLMQLMPFMLDDIAYTKAEETPLNDIDINLDAYGVYLNSLLQKYKGSYIKAIAAYNAGPESVDRWLKWYPELSAMEFIEFIPYKETRRYVKAVLFNAFMYGSLYGYPIDDILKEVKENGRI